MRTATARTSQPKVRVLRGPWSPSSGIELGVPVSNELKYEIVAIPNKYGQSHIALRQSSGSARAFESVSLETARSPAIVRILGCRQRKWPGGAPTPRARHRRTSSYASGIFTTSPDDWRVDSNARYADTGGILRQRVGARPHTCPVCSQLD